MGSACYGYCASRNLAYFGDKRVMLTTLDGMPVYYDLVPAHTDERQAAEVVLTQVTQASILGDQGFMGVQWQAQLWAETGNTIYTPPATINTLANLLISRPASIPCGNGSKPPFM